MRPERAGKNAPLSRVTTAVSEDRLPHPKDASNLTGTSNPREWRTDGRLAVMPEAKLVSYSGSGSFAIGADLFRYALLSKDLGYWVDMDLYFLKPLDFEGPYVFGWESDI